MNWLRSMAIQTKPSDANPVRASSCRRFWIGFVSEYSERFRQSFSTSHAHSSSMPDRELIPLVGGQSPLLQESLIGAGFRRRGLCPPLPWFSSFVQGRCSFCRLVQRSKANPRDPQGSVNWLRSMAIQTKPSDRKPRESIILSTFLDWVRSEYSERFRQSFSTSQSHSSCRLAQRSKAKARDPKGSVNWLRSMADQTKPSDANPVRASSCRCFSIGFVLSILSDSASHSAPLRLFFSWIGSQEQRQGPHTEGVGKLASFDGHPNDAIRRKPREGYHLVDVSRLGSF